MNKVTQLGSYLFAVAIIGFGLIQFAIGTLPSEFFPLPQNMVGKNVLAYATGLVFIITGFGILLNKSAKLCALLISLIFFLYLVFIHIYKIATNLHNPSEWVAFLETLSFSCGGFILVSAMPNNSVFYLKWDYVKIKKYALHLFALAIFIFGIQHIMYEKFIITLIPAWIPAKIIFSHLVKFAFISGSISIFINKKRQLAAFLLGSMFLTWAIILHAPRVFSTPNIEPEWTSLLVALAMSGVCFVISGINEKQQI